MVHAPHSALLTVGRTNSHDVTLTSGLRQRRGGHCQSYSHVLGATVGAPAPSPSRRILLAPVLVLVSTLFCLRMAICLARSLDRAFGLSSCGGGGRLWVGSGLEGGEDGIKLALEIGKVRLKGGGSLLTPEMGEEETMLATNLRGRP
ncbi:hypothetical protein NW767_000963 [Fusarium falciforme]|nr:hypothetical protein NW767_000963 [Fusarium falciforme]